MLCTHTHTHTHTHIHTYTDTPTHTYMYTHIRTHFPDLTRECSPMVRETWVQSQVKSYQRLKKWYRMPPCLTLSIIRYGSKVKWSNPGKGVAPSPSYRKGSLPVALDYGRQLYLLIPGSRESRIICLTLIKNAEYELVSYFTSVASITLLTDGMKFLETIEVMLMIKYFHGHKFFHLLYIL